MLASTLDEDEIIPPIETNRARTNAILKLGEYHSSLFSAPVSGQIEVCYYCEAAHRDIEQAAL